MATDSQHERHQVHQHTSHYNENGKTFTEKNRDHWDQFAATYTAEQWQKDLINRITSFILCNISWIGADFIDPATKDEASDSWRRVRVLDYACGPGTMTNALEAHANEFIGMDLSENMVKAYNTRFAPDDGTDLVARAIVCNLLDAEDPSPAAVSGPEFFDFDLVIIGLGFHHFENLEEATKRFVARLKPGGVLLIIDFLPHGDDGLAPHKHPAQHTVAHHGFGADRVQEIFDGAGLKDIGVLKMDGEVYMKGLSPRTPFMGRGKKPGLK